jgi:hypothetical protein
LSSQHTIKTPSKKEFRDAIHGFIPIYEEELQIIDNPVFQRLRGRTSIIIIIRLDRGINPIGWFVSTIICTICPKTFVVPGSPIFDNMKERFEKRGAPGTNCSAMARLYRSVKELVVEEAAEGVASDPPLPKNSVCKSL